MSKQIIHFFHNAMMIINLSLSSNHHYTQLTKIYSDKSLPFATFCYTSLPIYLWDNLKSAMQHMYHHTHRLANNHIYYHTQQYANIICTHTHSHTHTKRVICNSNVNILLTVLFKFFCFSKIVLFPPEDCHIKKARNQLSQINIHAIKYI